MEQIIKIKSGEKFKPFIPFWNRIKFYIGLKELSKDDVLWKDIDTKEIYKFNNKKSELRLLR